MANTSCLAVCPHDCPDTCSMLVTVDEKRATLIRGNSEHPFTKGFLCHKVLRYLERVYHPQRLKFPQRRFGPKGAGRFERISWSAALDEIATNLSATTNSTALIRMRIVLLQLD